MTDKQLRAQRERSARAARKIEERMENTAMAYAVFDENGVLAVKITGYWTHPSSGWMLHAVMRVLPRNEEIQDAAEALGYDRWNIVASDTCGGIGFSIERATMESLMYQMQELLESPAMGLHYPTANERDTDLSCWLHNNWFKVFSAKGWKVYELI